LITKVNYAREQANRLPHDIPPNAKSIPRCTRAYAINHGQTTATPRDSRFSLALLN